VRSLIPIPTVEALPRTESPNFDGRPLRGCGVIKKVNGKT